jgi:hypothetical protein
VFESSPLNLQQARGSHWPRWIAQSAAFERTPHGDSAHLQFESGFGGVTDNTDGDTDHSPQHVAAQQRKSSADMATDGLLGLPAESFVHTMRLKALRLN